MSWVAAAVAVGTAAYGAYNQYQTKQEAKDNARDIFGRRPETAPFTPIDLNAETARSLAGNQANLPAINALLERILPGFGAISGNVLRNAQSLTAGEIPLDVQNAVRRGSAQGALSGGYGGSQMHGNLTARDFGLTSLDLIQRGQNSAQQWAQTAEQAYSPWLSSAQEQAGVTRTNNAGVQAQQQRAFDIAAGADPGVAGQFAVNAAANANTANNVIAAGGAFNQAYATSRAPQYRFDYTTGTFMPTTVGNARPEYGRIG